MTTTSDTVLGEGAGLGADCAKARWQSYYEYRESGVSWLEQIPGHWSSSYLKYSVSKIQSGGTPDTSNPDYWAWGEEPGVPWVAIGDMTKTGIVLETEKRLTAKGLASKKLPVLPVGTLLYSMYASLGKVAVLGVDAVVNQAILGIVPDARVAVQDYLGYWLRCMEAHLELFSSSNTQENLNAAKVRAMPVLLPPVAEQEAIVSFLDRKTREIDELIAKKRRLIELLQEKRTALITHAVTKGLNPDAPMKPSGVDWLGDVPEHWEVVRTKRIAALRSGHTPSRAKPEYWENCTIPWFGLVDVWQLRDGRREYLGETSEKISELGLSNSAADLLPPGTVVVSRTASVGFSGIMPEPMATTQDFVNWIPGPRVQPEFLLYVLRGMSQEFRRLTQGSTHMTIYMPDVWQFVAVVPPMDEQAAIVNYIRSQTRALFKFIDQISEAIERLIEYRQAVISSAVTGRVRVDTEVGRTHSDLSGDEAAALLDAEIVYQLRSMPSFGRVMKEKICVLAHYHAQLREIPVGLDRQAAGPANLALRDRSEQIARESEWFERRVQTQSGHDRSVFYPLKNSGRHRSRYKSAFGDRSKRISDVIELARTWDTKQAEIVATLYIAWNDLLLRNIDPTDEAILREVLDHWHEQKTRIPVSAWRRGLAWLRRSSLQPSGWGAISRGGEGSLFASQE